MQKESARVVLFGGPGTAKTPTAAKFASENGFLYLIVEEGIKSAKGHNGPAYKVENASQIDEFFKWWTTEKESRQFPGVVVDSLSQIAKMFLKDAEAKTRHGQQAYGIMADKTMEVVNHLIRDKVRHCLILAQMFLEERTVKHGLTETVINYHRPLFPGKKLDKDFAHEIDEIWYAHHTNVPGVGKTVAILTEGSDTVMARTRNGGLNALEPPDLTTLFKKITS